MSKKPAVMLAFSHNRKRFAGIDYRVLDYSKELPSGEVVAIK